MMTRRPLTFDADALRAFVTGMELGSFALAAERLGRSTSAISAQLKKLEQQSGTALVQKAGRHLALTAEGEIMLSYARRMLSLNDEAWAALQARGVSGEVRLGLQEDFGEVFTAGGPRAIFPGLSRGGDCGYRHAECAAARGDDAPGARSGPELGRARRTGF
ncbi:HTH-type transcriptional activator AllS [Raoultella ornithinolytica]|nr:HTH-type transcriptional activator AllS [Raoultella ornithinolytica]